MRVNVGGVGADREHAAAVDDRRRRAGGAEPRPSTVAVLPPARRPRATVPSVAATTVIRGRAGLGQHGSRPAAGDRADAGSRAPASASIVTSAVRREHARRARRRSLRAVAARSDSSSGTVAASPPSAGTRTQLPAVDIERHDRAVGTSTATSPGPSLCTIGSRPSSRRQLGELGRGERARRRAAVVHTTACTGDDGEVGVGRAPRGRLVIWNVRRSTTESVDVERSLTSDQLAGLLDIELGARAWRRATMPLTSPTARLRWPANPWCALHQPGAAVVGVGADVVRPSAWTAATTMDARHGRTRRRARRTGSSVAVVSSRRGRRLPIGVAVVAFGRYAAVTVAATADERATPRGAPITVRGRNETSRRSRCRIPPPTVDRRLSTTARADRIRRVLRRVPGPRAAMNRNVAIKVLNTGLATRRRAADVRTRVPGPRPARTIPNIVTVYTTAYHRRRPAVHRDGAVPTATTASALDRIGATAARRAARRRRAHRPVRSRPPTGAGVLHRDIKPHNIFLLARTASRRSATSGSRPSTTSAATAGRAGLSVAYAAPGGARGRRASAGDRRVLAGGDALPPRRRRGAVRQHRPAHGRAAGSSTEPPPPLARPDAAAGLRPRAARRRWPRIRPTARPPRSRSPRSPRGAGRAGRPQTPIPTATPAAGAAPSAAPPAGGMLRRRCPVWPRRWGRRRRPPGRRRPQATMPSGVTVARLERPQPAPEPEPAGPSARRRWIAAGAAVAAVAVVAGDRARRRRRRRQRDVHHGCRGHVTGRHLLRTLTPPTNVR